MSAKKGIVKPVLVLFLAGVVLQILFDPLSDIIRLGEYVQARIGLPAARRKWKSQEVTHYTFDIQGYVPLVCMFGGNIEVKDGVVIHTGPRSDARLTPGLAAAGGHPICNYKNYTMTLFFDELERWLHESPLFVSEISFDPKYGFITSFHFGSSGGQGLLSPRVSDSCGGFSIENFRVLEK